MNFVTYDIKLFCKELAATPVHQSRLDPAQHIHPQLLQWANSKILWYLKISVHTYSYETCWKLKSALLV
jgi:hypothetical protein